MVVAAAEATVAPRNTSDRRFIVVTSLRMSSSSAAGAFPFAASKSLFAPEALTMKMTVGTASAAVRNF